MPVLFVGTPKRPAQTRGSIASPALPVPAEKEKNDEHT